MSKSRRVALLICAWIVSFTQGETMAKLKSPVVAGMQDRERTFSNGVAEHHPIPALCKSGCVLMRLQFTEEERTQIDLGDDLFIEVLTGEGIQPMRFTVGDPGIAETWKAEGY